MNVTDLTEKAWTPKFVFNKASETADEAEDTIVISNMKDESVQILSSRMKPETFYLLVKRLEMYLEGSLYEQEDWS